MFVAQILRKKLKYKIYDIAKVQSGIYARPDLGGEIYYLQAKHFTDQREFDTMVQPDLKRDDKIAKHLLQAGDVLLAAKGNYNFAVHYKGLRPAVASSMFTIIRLKDKINVMPEYLTWYLNMESTKLVLRNLAKGTRLPSLSNGQVEQLNISVPSLEKQQIIVKINGLRKMERSILRQLQELKEQEIENLLMTSIKES